jgi:hypothetical protein
LIVNEFVFPCFTTASPTLKSLSIKQGIKYDDPESAHDIPAFIEFRRLDIDEILDPIDSSGKHLSCHSLVYSDRVTKKPSTNSAISMMSYHTPYHFSHLLTRPHSWARGVPR